MCNCVALDQCGTRQMVHTRVKQSDFCRRRTKTRNKKRRKSRRGEAREEQQTWQPIRQRNEEKRRRVPLSRQHRRKHHTQRALTPRSRPAATTAAPSAPRSAATVRLASQAAADMPRDQPLGLQAEVEVHLWLLMTLRTWLVVARVPWHLQAHLQSPSTSPSTPGSILTFALAPLCRSLAPSSRRTSCWRDWLWLAWPPARAWARRVQRGGRVLRRAAGAAALARVSAPEPPLPAGALASRRRTGTTPASPRASCVSWSRGAVRLPTGCTTCRNARRPYPPSTGPA